MELKDIRKEIDAIDDALLPLMIKRMEASRKVAEIKIRDGIPVLNQERENEILEMVHKDAGEFGDALRLIYASMFDVSRAEQHRLVGGGEALRRQIEKALADKADDTAQAVACQGVPGAYSGIAAKKLFPDGTLKYHQTFDDIFSAVESGEADYGILPVENSLAGSVHEVYDLILKHHFYIVKSIDLPVSHCLMAKPGAGLSHLKAVYSHTQGLHQCADYIDAHHLTPIEAGNTAMAAKLVAESDDHTICAIGSKLAAEEYGLEILAEGVQGVENNTTRFIIISRDMYISDAADKISMVFSLAHETGSLYRILARFAILGMNLTKIESRPIQDSRFKYYFYLDFSGNLRDEKTLDLMCALSDEMPFFSFLGNYHEYDG